MKKLTMIVMMIMMGSILGSCSDADIASHNLSKAADNFEVNRRVIFYNGITNEYMLSITGLCSIEDQRKQLEVTCRVGETKYKKHFLGLSDNVTYFVEHLEPTRASAYHYRVVFKPQTIIPDVDFRGSVKKGDLPLQNRGDQF